MQKTWRPTFTQLHNTPHNILYPKKPTKMHRQSTKMHRQSTKMHRQSVGRQSCPIYETVVPMKIYPLRHGVPFLSVSVKHLRKSQKKVLIEVLLIQVIMSQNSHLYI